MPTPEEIENILTNKYTEFNKNRDINIIADAIESYRKYHDSDLTFLSPTQQELLRDILSDLDPTGKFDNNYEDIR